MPSGLYDADGKIRLTQSPGSGFCGRYAPDGSIYFTTAPGSGFCGSTAPDGSMYIVDATGSTTIGVYAPNGAIRVTTGNEYNGAWRVSGVSSVVASWNASTSTLALLAAITTHSRTSLATMFDSTGKLTYAPNNLLTYSNTFSNAAWAKNLVTVTGGVSDPVGGSNASTITATGVNAFIYQGPTVAAGTRIASQLYVKRRTGSGSVFLYDQNGFTNTVDITASISGGGWVAINPSVLTASGSNAYVGVKINTSGDAVDVYAGVVAAVTYETAVRTQDQVITTSAAYYGPRIDYDPNTLAVKGLLIEEARTNGVINSTDPAVWAVLGVANTTGVTDPQAMTKAATVTAAAGAGYHYTSQTGATASAGQARVVSVFVKQGTAPYVNFGASGDASWHVGWMKWSDLSTGSTNGTVSVQALAGGYYRLSLAFTMTNASSVMPYVGPDVASRAIAPNYTAAGTETVIAWGLQDEPGYFATSYIPTAAASVTRAADVVQFTGAALTALQGSAATFIGQTIGLPFNPAANSALVAATAGNAVIAYVTNSNAVGVAAAATYNGAVALTVGTPNYTTAMRIGSAFSGSGRSLVVNGGSVATDANAIGSRPAVYLGGTGASFYLNGWVHSFAIYNARLPDATLQAKSVVGASY